MPTSPAALRQFDPVDTDFDTQTNSARDDVESPSLSSGNALARFEFEPGRSKEGTKVLMVEWEDDASTIDVREDWEISWQEKTTVLPARELADAAGDSDEANPVNRLYFLLGPGVAVPTTVKLQKGSVTWRTNPLPAIFPPELGATARQAGGKGVLHTIWAKKRLQGLRQEIETELQDNPEGLGLQMAVAEKEWIEKNFGVVTTPSSMRLPAQGAAAGGGGGGPASPRSPGGGRLMDKLRGLSIGTTEKPDDFDSDTHYHNPLSPEGSDVAVGGFSSFAQLKGMPPPSTLAAKSAQPPQPKQQRRFAPQRPPDAFAAEQQQVGGAGMGSLNAFAKGEVGSAGMMNSTGEKEDDLFALPMSPRSPESSKSPFSFGKQDTIRYLRGGKA